MPLLIEVAVKTLLIIVALSVLAWRAYRGRTPPPSRRSTALVMAIGLVTYTNWGAFHDKGGMVHDWDQYHYVISSKYYPELGHDGLYVATALAAEQLGEPVPSRIRDLRNQRVVDFGEVAEHRHEVRGRFDEARWAAFVDDIDTFQIHPWAYIDHGYNPPPPLTAVLRTLTSWIPVTRVTLHLYAVLDTMLLFGCVLIVGWVFGLERAAEVALLIGVSFVARYFWNGGSILRYDWLLAVTAALALLHRDRPGAAGLALGYAAAVRIFPAMFALPVLAFYAVRLRSASHARSLGRFVAGLAVSGIVLGGFGAAFNGRGPAAYLEMGDKIAHHDAAPPPNNLGLRTLLITSTANLDGQLTSEASVYETNAIAADYVAQSESRALVIRVAGLLGLAFALWVGARSTTPMIAAMSGTIAMFGLTALTCYYWVVLALLPLWSVRNGLRLGLASNLAMYLWGAVALFSPLFGLVERFNVALVFLPCAIIVLGVLGWCAAETLRSTGGAVSLLPQPAASR